MNNKKLNDFFNMLTPALEKKELIKILLSGKRNKQSDLKNIIITIVSLKKGLFLNFVYRYNTKDITKNYKIQEGKELIENALSNEFYNAHLYTKTNDVILQLTPRGKDILKISPSTLELPKTFNHDNDKTRIIKTDNNIYLRELGIVNSNWEIRKEMNDKYRQINQYIELLKPYLTDRLLADDCTIVDMGAGKGYLTFALYDYITNNLKRAVKIVGVEMRPNLVDVCNVIAQKCKFDNLYFMNGAIKDVKLDKVSVLIALHACDTATDDSIYRGIMDESSLIVCAPCCHKQLRKEFNVSNSLRNITKHGILLERQSEILTDGLRALLLEAFGYRTNVFQFIETEHTPKNVMIIGERVGSADTKKILSEIYSIKELFGIQEHYLEKLLDTRIKALIGADD